MVKLNLDILEKEINQSLDISCELRKPPIFKDVWREAHTIAKCPKKTFAIRYKGYDPFLSDISMMKTYVDAYEDKMDDDVTPIIFFVGKQARDYVQDFADELDIQLIPVKNRKKLNFIKDTILKGM